MYKRQAWGGVARVTVQVVAVVTRGMGAYEVVVEVGGVGGMTEGPRLVKMGC